MQKKKTRKIAFGQKLFTHLLIIILAGTALSFHNRYQALKDVMGDFEPDAINVELIEGIYPEAASVHQGETPHEAASILDEKGNVIGYALDSRPFSDHFRGHGGPVPLLIIFDREEIVQGIVLLDNNETPSFIDRIKEAGFLKNWEGIELQKIPEKEVDAVSRATMSCNAIERGIRKRVAIYLDHAYPEDSFVFSRMEFLSLIPLILVVFSVLKPKLFNHYRLLIQLTTVAVLGFITSTMFSMSVFRGWVYHGPRLSTQWPLIIMGIAVLFFLVVRKQNIYCAHLCPYGLLQILAFKLPVKKLKVPTAINKMLPFTRSMALLVFFILLIQDLDFDPGHWEPFAAFSFMLAPLSTIIIAVVFLVISIFIPRLWCRMLCPTGKCVDMLKTNT